jgi:hypothetical protein
MTTTGGPGRSERHRHAGIARRRHFGSIKSSRSSSTSDRRLPSSNSGALLWRWSRTSAVGLKKRMRSSVGRVSSVPETAFSSLCTCAQQPPLVVLEAKVGSILRKASETSRPSASYGAAADKLQLPQS